MENLTPSLIATTVAIVLFGLLTGAVLSDVKARRIPNRLVLIGALIGMTFNSVLPAGSGFLSVLPGSIGLHQALVGCLVGLTVLLPLYLLGVMGAGDVKLMAMVGAFVGPTAVISVVLLTFIAGGVLGLIVVMRDRTVARLVNNLRLMLMSSFFKLMMHEVPRVESAPVSAGKLPYGVAIFGGAFLYLLMTKSGYKPHWMW